MSEYKFIGDFNPFKDDMIDFLSKVRSEFSESYGDWIQTSYLDTDDPYIEVDIRTGGWSDNEAVVDAILSNSYIRSMFYYSWRRGGQHVFRFVDLHR